MTWIKFSNMKKIIIFAVALISSSVSFCQTELGIFVGPHASSATYSIKAEKQSTDLKYGFHIGVQCKIPFENRLDFVPAISYNMMGYKVAFTQPSFPPDLLAKDNNTRFHQVDIDVLLQYNLSKKANHLFIKAGPSFNFILFGKENFNLETGEYVNRKMKFSTTNSYGRYGVSAVIQFGFETSGGFTVSSYYAHGLFDMNNEDKGPSIRNYLFGVTLGKFLRSKKLVMDTRNKQ
jgi:hypothetical protein